MTLEEARADLMLAQADVSYRPKDDSIDMAIQALENRKSVIEELENVKDEVIRDAYMMYDYSKEKSVITVDDLCKIIHRRIYKLKRVHKMSNLFYEHLEKQSNGTDLKEFAIEELEKIICELRKCYPSMPIFNKRKWGEENKAYLDCESIIFKHISELKGE